MPKAKMTSVYVLCEIKGVDAHTFFFIIRAHYIPAVFKQIWQTSYHLRNDPLDIFGRGARLG